MTGLQSSSWIIRTNSRLEDSGMVTQGSLVLGGFSSCHTGLHACEKIISPTPTAPSSREGKGREPLLSSPLRDLNHLPPPLPAPGKGDTPLCYNASFYLM